MGDSISRAERERWQYLANEPSYLEWMKFVRERLQAVPGLMEGVLLNEAGERATELYGVLQIATKVGHVERYKRKKAYHLYLPFSYTSAPTIELQSELAPKPKPEPEPKQELAPISSAEVEQDTEEQYRQHLAYLIGRTKSRGNTKYFNQYVNRCRNEAAARFPKGAAAARKKDGATTGVLGMLGALFSIFG